MSALLRWEDWPDSLRALDQYTNLYPSEADVLRTWAAMPDIASPGEWNPSAAWAGMQRLLEPVQHVFVLGDSEVAYGAAEYACCVLLLREMHRRQTSLWAWDEPTWLDIVGRNSQTFVSTHHFGQLYPFAKPTAVRHLVLRCAYLLATVPVYTLAAKTDPVAAATRLFGPDALLAAVSTVQTELQRGGWLGASSNSVLTACLARVLLHNRSPHLEAITFRCLEQVHQSGEPALRRACVLLSKALHSLGMLPQPLTSVWTRTTVRQGQADTVPVAWQELIDRWAAVADCNDSLRHHVCYHAAKAGRWSAAQPNAPGPAQWTKETARQFVAAVQVVKLGQWAHPALAGREGYKGRDMKPASKGQLLNCLRRFFFDCQDWGWLPPVFRPKHYLATPRKVLAQCEFKPRVIEEAIWGKLLAAALSLTPADLEGDTSVLPRGGVRKGGARYPFELVRAVAVTWLLAGLRDNELRRLSVGCLRHRPVKKGYAAWLEAGAVPGACYLRVPVHKTGKAFEKPIPQAAGDVIAAWEKIRPACPPQRDRKTGALTHFLFIWRGSAVSRVYINDWLVPLLCRKAGVPTHDTDGPITSHRARATIVTQMFLSGLVGLLDLQKWLGHRSLRSTLRYIDVPEEFLLDAFVKANARIIQQATRHEAGALTGSEAVASPGTSRAQVLAAIHALEQLCAAKVLSDADYRSVQDQIASLQQLAQRLPPDATGQPPC